LKLSHSAEPNTSNAGFTLIEVLVALSIIAVALSSIGALMASAARANRSVEAHLSTIQTARSVVTALPDRNQLKPGDAVGEIARQKWRVRVMPYLLAKPNTPSTDSWIPQSVVISVRSPTGVAIELYTIRLRHRSSR
jgi:general secretion pathway protein I